jgi:CLASP N terminal
MTMKRSTQNPVVKNMSKLHAEPPTIAMLQDASNAGLELPPPIDPKLKDDENPAKPLEISSPRDFDDMSQAMHGVFEGKETEQNWDKRRKAVIKISRVTHGNAPNEYRAPYTSFIKSQLDSILKVVDSLRTNVTTTGLNTLQHIAGTLGQGVDFMVDFVADTLITRSCNTSKVKRDPAIATFETIVSNATCNKNLLHYIVSASEHKDPNARTAVSTWLMAILNKNGRHCDQAGVLDLIDKCIKNGLNDAKPQVRTPMRTTYATYATLWPDRAARLRDGLDLKTQKMLDTNLAVEPAKLSIKQRPSIRDIKAAKKKELDAQEKARPGSAHSNRPSIKDVKATKMGEINSKEFIRPPSSQSNTIFVKDVKVSKRRENDPDTAAGHASEETARTSKKGTKVARKRDAGMEDNTLSLLTQSTRSSTRDVKTASRRVVDDADDMSHVPSSQPTVSSTIPDTEMQVTARSQPGNTYTSSNERRYNILSSAPVRPQRGSVDSKRVPPKPASSPPQPTAADKPVPPQLDDYGLKMLDAPTLAKIRERVAMREKQDEALAMASSSRSHVRKETTSTIPVHGEKAGKHLQDTTIMDRQAARPTTNDRATTSKHPAGFTKDQKRVGKPNDSQRSRSPTSKNGKAPVGRLNPTLEDNDSTNQVRTKQVSQVPKRPSAERMNEPKDKATVPNRMRATSSVKAPVQTLQRKTSADQPGHGKISQVTKRLSAERMNESKDAAEVPKRKNSTSSSKSQSFPYLQTKRSADKVGAGKVPQVTKRLSAEGINESKDIKVPNRTRSTSSSKASAQPLQNKNSTDQHVVGKVSQVTKRRSAERVNNGLNGETQVPHRRSIGSISPPVRTKVSQVTKRRSNERVNGTSRDATKRVTKKRSISSSNTPIPIHEDQTSAQPVRVVPQVPRRHSAARVQEAPRDVARATRKRSTSSPNPPTVLREIDQLNETMEPVKKQENIRQKYISTETAERNRSVSPQTKNPDKARKQLSRAVEQIRARTMDDYGYRRLQGLIKAHETLFQDEQKYDDLLLALLDTLESPNTERRQPLGRQFNNKFQILVTIRLMLLHSAKYCAAYHARALSALITARRNFEARCHIVGGLEETAEDIVAACSPTEVIDPILDVLELQEYGEAGYRAIAMGLQMLGGVVARIKGSEIADKGQEERLTRYALKCLRNENSETRRATIAFCVELRRVINPEARYFQVVAGNDEALKSLLTYFIATNRRN